MKFLFPVLVAAGAMFLSTPAMQAQASGSTATVPMGNTQQGPSQAGVNFIKEAAQGNMAEIRMGELAEQRGASQAVRQYGAALVNDHAKSENQLKDLADQEGVRLPAQPDPHQQNVYERLSRLSGPQFDQEFMKAQVQAHQREIAAFQGESQAGKDPNVARYAQRSLPTLQMHLKMAQDAQQKLAAGQGAAAGK
jgi:putative membrane protein